MVRPVPKRASRRGGLEHTHAHATEQVVGSLGVDSLAHDLREGVAAEEELPNVSADALVNQIGPTWVVKDEVGHVENPAVEQDPLVTGANGHLDVMHREGLVRLGNERAVQLAIRRAAEKVWRAQGVLGDLIVCSQDDEGDCDHNEEAEHVVLYDRQELRHAQVAVHHARRGENPAEPAVEPLGPEEAHGRHFGASHVLSHEGAGDDLDDQRNSNRHADVLVGDGGASCS